MHFGPEFQLSLADLEEAALLAYPYNVGCPYLH